MIDLRTAKSLNDLPREFNAAKAMLEPHLEWRSYSGRTDDMLKVGGIYVSPIEVEEAISSHEDALEAAVIDARDNDDLEKPHAYLVLRGGLPASEECADEFKRYVKAKLAPYKYPRWVSFVDELPKTATGKIQRFRLRGKA